MEYRKLGKTDIEVSKICLGTMTWGYQNTEEEAHEQMDYALAHNINFFDTAEMYAIPPQRETQGLTEKYIGNRFAKTGNRNKVVLATKVVGPNPNFDRMRGGEGFTVDGIKAAVEGSLKRLQTDHIDLYQLHRPQRTIPVRGKENYSDEMWDATNRYEEHIVTILETLAEVQKEGKVRHFGLSNETPWGTMKFLQLAEKHNLPRMQSIQNAHSLIRREFEVGLAEICLQEGVSSLPYSPLAGGILTGKYQGGKKPEGARYSSRGKSRMPYYMQEKSFAAADKYIALAEELGISVTQLSLAWLTDRVFVTSNIIGATKMHQLEECISSADIVLSKESRDRIDEIFNEDKNPATR